MTETTSAPADGADAPSQTAPDKTMHELYIGPSRQKYRDPREAEMDRNLDLILDGRPDSTDPDDRLKHQLLTLDIMFHVCAMKGFTWDSAFFNQAFTAQKLFRESVKIMKIKEKE